MTTRSIRVLLVAAIFAAVASAVFAAEAPPQPAAEMSNLKVFDGSWTCEGKALAGPMGPGGAVSSKVESHSDLGGFWQTGSVKATGPSMPSPMEGMFNMTYDPGAKQYVMLWMDNSGAWSQEMSSGWEGDKLVFSGESTMGGNKMKVRDTFVKGADGSLQHDWEGQVDGKWTPMGSETCKHGGKA